MEEKKKVFGRGVYGSKEVPIQLLDALIGGCLIVIVALIIWFASHGGYIVSYETDGGSEVVQVKAGYGDLLIEPTTPTKPGYVFDRWVTAQDPYLAQDWNFETDIVEENLQLYAVWTPALIVVKFDLEGGSYQDNDAIEAMEVIYGEPYGTLPIPTKEGMTFAGWIYSGKEIQADTVVEMTGEHVLTAKWQ